MGINPARRTAIRVLGSGCFSHFGVLALERNNSAQFTPASKAGLLAEGTARKIGRHALSREDFGQRQPKSDWYSSAWGTWEGEGTSRSWLCDQLTFRVR